MTGTSYLGQAEEPAWFVAHTRPRCEKKLAEFCEREGVSVTLPLYRSVKEYVRKSVTFEKPLFPNYLFLKMRPLQRKRIYQSDYVANLLDVPDQSTFERQLRDILTALETDLEICVLPHIAPGKLARITAGPLRGLEGEVAERQGVSFVLLRLDFIAQSAAVQVRAEDLEIVG